MKDTVKLDVIKKVSGNGMNGNVTLSYVSLS